MSSLIEAQVCRTCGVESGACMNSLREEPYPIGKYHAVRRADALEAAEAKLADSEALSERRRVQVAGIDATAKMLQPAPSSRGQGRPMTLTFRVVGQPVAWSRTRMAFDYQRNTPRFFTADASRDWQHQLATAATLAMWQQGWTLTTDPVTVSMVVYRQIPASTSKRKAAELVGTPCAVKPDADNYLKQLDALNGVVWKDDAQVVTATVSKRWARPEDAGVSVEVRK